MAGRYELRAAGPADAVFDDRAQADREAAKMARKQQRPFIIRDTFTGTVWPSSGFPFSTPPRRKRTP